MLVLDAPFPPESIWSLKSFLFYGFSYIFSTLPNFSRLHI
uniref:Uncharacterized protein n=1 Tax=Arundo donax TaxID=35708 RepID=A0A0A9FWK3_ARUDO